MGNGAAGRFFRAGYEQTLARTRAEVTTMAKIYTRREARRRRMNFQIFAGIYDFIGVVAGIVVIIACVVLLSSMVNWVLRDGRDSFASLWNIFESAIIIPK